MTPESGIINKNTAEEIPMAKQKKNANYVTEKTEQAKVEKAEKKKKEKQKKIIETVAFWSGAALIIIGAIFLFLMAIGVFDYAAEGTHHATVTMSDGTTLHIELYGEDAPETVEHLVALCNRGYFNDMSIDSLINNQLAMGDDRAGGYTLGITGEFAANGVDNQVEMKKGTVCLGRGNDFNSGYGQFFILTKNDDSLKGSYAAFGRVTDTLALDRLVKKCSFDSEGNCTDGPTILSISIHDSH